MSFTPSTMLALGTPAPDFTRNIQLLSCRGSISAQER